MGDEKRETEVESLGSGSANSVGRDQAICGLAFERNCRWVKRPADYAAACFPWGAVVACSWPSAASNARCIRSKLRFD